MVMVPIRNQPHYYIKMRECEHTATRNLEEEPRTVPSASTRPPGTNAPAQGVSTRDLPYLFDEPGGEYERSFIHPSIGSPVICMCICSPLSRGSQAETKTLSLYYAPATQRTLAQRVRGAEGGSTREVLLQLCLSI
jgi:hypothetical protein